MIQDILMYFVYLPLMFTTFGVAYFAFKQEGLYQSKLNAYAWRFKYNNLTKR